MRYLAIVGLMAVLAAPALAAEGTINVSVTVEPILAITVLDAALTWTTSGLADLDNDLKGKLRAKFDVSANTDYVLKVTSSNGTWLASAVLPSPYDTYKQVKFQGTSDTFIGGSLLLDSTPDVLSDNASNTGWNGATGEVVTGTQAAGTHTWGLSGAFAPKLVGDGSHTTGIPGAIAPQDTYSTDAVITVSVP